MNILTYSQYLEELVSLLTAETPENQSKAYIEQDLIKLTSVIPKVDEKGVQQHTASGKYPNDFLSRILLDNFETLFQFIQEYSNISLTHHLNKFLVKLIHSLQFWEIYHLIYSLQHLRQFLTLLSFEVVDTLFGYLIRPPYNYFETNIYQGFQYPFPYPFYNYSYHILGDNISEKYNKIHIKPYIDITLKNIDVKSKRPRVKSYKDKREVKVYRKRLVDDQKSQLSSEPNELETTELGNLQDSEITQPSQEVTDPPYPLPEHYPPLQGEKRRGRKRKYKPEEGPLPIQDFVNEGDAISKVQQAQLMQIHQIQMIQQMQMQNGINYSQIPKVESPKSSEAPPIKDEPATTDEKKPRPRGRPRGRPKGRPKGSKNQPKPQKQLETTPSDNLPTNELEKSSSQVIIPPLPSMVPYGPVPTVQNGYQYPGMAYNRYIPVSYHPYQPMDYRGIPMPMPYYPGIPQDAPNPIEGDNVRATGNVTTKSTSRTGDSEERSGRNESPYVTTFDRNNDLDAEDMSETSKPEKEEGEVISDESSLQYKSHDKGPTHQCKLLDPNSLEPCLKLFYGKNELLRHQEFVHATRKRIYKCVYCAKDSDKVQSYPRHDSLSRHIRRKHQVTGKENKLAVNYAKENVEIIDDSNLRNHGQLLDIATQPLPHPPFLNPDFTLRSNITGFLSFNTNERHSPSEDESKKHKDDEKDDDDDKEPDVQDIPGTALPPFDYRNYPYTNFMPYYQPRPQLPTLDKDTHDP